MYVACGGTADFEAGGSEGRRRARLRKNCGHSSVLGRAGQLFTPLGRYAARDHAKATLTPVKLTGEKDLLPQVKGKKTYFPVSAGMPLKLKRRSQRCASKNRTPCRVLLLHAACRMPHAACRMPLNSASLACSVSSRASAPHRITRWPLQRCPSCDVPLPSCNSLFCCRHSPNEKRRPFEVRTKKKN